MSKPVRVTVTGAAGQIGYSLVFRIASGAAARPRPAGRPAAAGDPARRWARSRGSRWSSSTAPSRCSAGLDLHDNPEDAFDGTNIALLVGSRPRTKGMERAELLTANGEIFTVQGKALNERAADDVKVLVVGNPANTNCLIAMNNAPDVPSERFTSMMRLDHNRAVAQLANKLAVPVDRGQRDGRVGQPLADDVPGPLQCKGRRSPGGRSGRRPGMDRERVPAERR